MSSVFGKWATGFHQTCSAGSLFVRADLGEKQSAPHSPHEDTDFPLPPQKYSDGVKATSFDLMTPIGQASQSQVPAPVLLRSLTAQHLYSYFNFPSWALSWNCCNTCNPMLRMSTTKLAEYYAQQAEHASCVLSSGSNTARGRALTLLAGHWTRWRSKYSIFSPSGPSSQGVARSSQSIIVCSRSDVAHLYA
jgi:hypothetical protein